MAETTSVTMRLDSDDYFYNKSNLDHLERSISQLNSGHISSHT